MKLNCKDGHPAIQQSLQPYLHAHRIQISEINWPYCEGRKRKGSRQYKLIGRAGISPRFIRSVVSMCTDLANDTEIHIDPRMCEQCRCMSVTDTAG